MNAKNDERFKSPADREAFERAIRDNLSPDAVATAIVALRAAESGNQPTDERALAALREVEWLADLLTETLGVEEHQRLMEELAL
jgi:hypothetical protein